MIAQLTTMRVMSVDDHALVREGLALIINSQPDMVMVCSAQTVEDAISMYCEYRPDVILVDLRLQGQSGVDVIAGIRAIDKNARIIVLTMYRGDEDVRRAVDAGAAAYVLKDANSKELLNTIRAVGSGEKSSGLLAETDVSSKGRLTRREVEVMKLVALGLRNKEIAADLHISVETVEVHLRNIFEKLDVEDRTGAVSVALRRGIIHLE